MKKLILLLLILTSIIFAQNEIKSDTTMVENIPKTNDDYRVSKNNDTWMDTWKEIQPSIRDFLSDEEYEKIENAENNNMIKKPRKKRGYFRAGAGGWEIVNIPIELTEINNQIVNKMGLKKFDANMFYHGGGGWGFIGSKYRIGGMGADGKMITSGIVDGIRKKVDFSMSFSGFLIERVFHPMNKTELYLCAVIGGTSTKIKVSKKKGAEDWNDAWTSFNNTGSDFYSYETTFTNNFFSAMPSIGFRYNIFRVFGVGAKVGYYYGIANKNSWEINGDEIGGVQKMDLSNIFYGVNFYFGA